MADPTRPEQQKIDLTPGQNFLTWTHHYALHNIYHFLMFNIISVYLLISKKTCGLIQVVKGPDQTFLTRVG